MSEFEKLERALEQKTQQESGGGIRVIPPYSRIGRVFAGIYEFLRGVFVRLEKAENKHLIHGLLLGVALFISVWLFYVNPTFGIIVFVFMLIYHVVSYPDSVRHVQRFFGLTIFGLVRRGTIISILEPEEIESGLSSVEFILSIFVWGLLAVFIPQNVIAIFYETLSAVFVGISSIAYYYFSSVNKCWDDPTREISERDIFSRDFLVFFGLFTASLSVLYRLVPLGFHSVFGWFVVFMTYLFLSSVMAIPNFQTAVSISLRWRGISSTRDYDLLEGILS